MRRDGVVIDDDRVLGRRTRLMADHDRRMTVQRARQRIGAAEPKNQQHTQPDDKGEATDHRRIMTNHTRARRTPFG
jgi:hypothetical protein